MSHIWSTVIFQESNDYDIFEKKPSNEILHLGKRKIKSSKLDPHTIADPMLFNHQDKLFIFAEVQRYKENGFINCWSTTDGYQWIDNGPILQKSFHLSFPLIFKDNQKIYMVPEQVSFGKTQLYEFKDFPYKPIPVAIISDGPIADPVLFIEKGTYFLIGTQDEMLKLYFSEDLLKNNWSEHPFSRSISSNQIRNAGPILRYKNKLLRFTQDCTTNYGDKIIIKEIMINQLHYSEKIIETDFRHSAKNQFDKLGRHQISLANFKGNTFIAMDGKMNDFIINKLMNVLFSI